MSDKTRRILTFFGVAIPIVIAAIVGLQVINRPAFHERYGTSEMDLFPDWQSSGALTDSNGNLVLTDSGKRIVLVILNTRDSDPDRYQFGVSDGTVYIGSSSSNAEPVTVTLSNHSLIVIDPSTGDEWRAGIATSEFVKETASAMDENTVAEVLPALLQVASANEESTELHNAIQRAQAHVAKADALHTTSVPD